MAGRLSYSAVLWRNRGANLPKAFVDYISYSLDHAAGGLSYAHQY